MESMEEIIFEKQRRQCWIDAYCAVANTHNCMHWESAIRWADAALKAFDEQFKKPEDQQSG